MVQRAVEYSSPDSGGVRLPGGGIGLLYSGWQMIYNGFLAPMEPGSTEEVGFAVASGDSLTKVSNNLQDAGLIHDRTVFKYYCDFAGMGQKIQAGSTSSPGNDHDEIADQLTTGDGNPLCGTSP